LTTFGYKFDDKFDDGEKMKFSEIMDNRNKKTTLPNPVLPATCPLNTGGRAPRGCRFSNDLLMTLIGAGVMPDQKAGCMFKHVCGELSSTKNDSILI
jgi:hypothetical protein